MGMVNVSNLGFGGTGIPDALPKAIAELQGIRVQVVAGATGGTLVAVDGMDPEDTIVAAVNLTDGADVDVADLTIEELNAFATITCLDTAADGDYVTVNGKRYTFRDVVVSPSYNAPPGVVPMTLAGSPPASDPEEMADRLAKAIMSGDSTLTASVGYDTSSPPLLAKVTVKVRQAGTAGNSTTLTETGTAVTVSGAQFTGGAASTSQGFSSGSSLSGKKILLVWFDKRPGAAVQPL